NSWRAELRSFRDMSLEGNLHHLTWSFHRSPTEWELCVARLMPSGWQHKSDLPPPLQDGDPDAALVLSELLRSPETNVRILAANGLERIGPLCPRNALLALIDAAEDDDPEVALAAEQALWFVDPYAAIAHAWRQFPWFNSPEDVLFLDSGALLFPQTPAGFGHLLRYLLHSSRPSEQSKWQVATPGRLRCRA